MRTRVDLPGPVRAQEPVDLARGDGEVDAVDGPVVAELAGDVLGDDGRARPRAPRLPVAAGRLPTRRRSRRDAPGPGAEGGAS